MPDRVKVSRSPVARNPGIYTVIRADRSLRYGAVVDVRGAWGKDRVQKRRESFLTLADAKEWRVRQLADVMGGKSEGAGNRTLGWWVSEWLELRSGDLEHATQVSYREHLGRFSGLFRTPLVKITPADIEIVLVRLRDALAPSTVNVCRVVLSVCFGAAVNLGLIVRNPVRATSSVRMNRGRKEVWNSDQVSVLLDVTRDDEELGVVFRLLAETWMRVGEACGLRWGDIDFSAGTIRVARTMRRSDKGWVVGSGPKTRAAVRVLPVSSVLLELLRARKDRQRFRGVRDSVLTTTPDAIRRRLCRVCVIQGWPPVGPHMLRHAGATMAAAAGMEPRVIQERLGHSHIAMTLERYVHPSADAHRKAADVMAGLLESRDVAP